MLEFTPITKIPRTPDFTSGVINLRDAQFVMILDIERVVLAEELIAVRRAGAKARGNGSA